MPNRILKESICTSDTIDALSPEEERFFYRLIVQCDDYGRLDARPVILRSKLFPLKINYLADKDICKLLSKLIQVKLIIVYLIEDRPYIQVTTWEKHQQIRAKRSRYPEHTTDNHLLTPDMTCNLLLSNDFMCNQRKSNVTVIQSNPIQSNPNPNPNQEIGGSRGINPLLSEKIIKKPDFTLPDGIDNKIWNAYLETRKKLKAPSTEHAIKLVVTELQKIKTETGDNPNDILNQSILRGWRGVFPIKRDAKENSRQKKGNLVEEPIEGLTNVKL